MLVLGCFKCASYSLLGRVSIRLYGLSEHNWMLEPIAYRAGKFTTSLCPILQWEHAMAPVIQVLRPENLRKWNWPIARTQVYSFVMTLWYSRDREFCVRLPLLSVCLNKMRRFGRLFCISHKMKCYNCENYSVGSTWWS